MRQFFEQFLIGEDLEELAHIFYVRVLINRCQCKKYAGVLFVYFSIFWRTAWKRSPAGKTQK